MEQPLENQYGFPRQAPISMRGNAKRGWDEHRKHRLKGVSGRPYSRKIFSLAPLGLLLYLSLDGASAQLQQKYCSSQNTGEDHYVGSEQWQTLGLCKDNCVLYAFGVVKGFECWCSDYAPNPSKARTDCVTCPQYNLEKCGNSKTGAYGYIDTGTRPKGTADASNSPTSTTTSSSTLTVSDPNTLTLSSRETTTPSSTKAGTMLVVSSIVETTTVFISKESTTMLHTTPWVSVLTVGTPQTVTFTPSGWIGPTADSSPNSSGNDNFFDNAGRVAGVFTVLALLMIALIFALFWYLRRRRQRGAPLGADSPIPESLVLIGSAVHEKRRSRSMSTLGLTAPYASDRPHLPPPIVTTNTGSSAGSGVLSAVTPDRITDQRLDPGQVWMRFENDNASRMSVRSLRDDQDYSRRVLRLANPDED
ncbi:hypothetical protein EV426DRAFT_577208 [Tirmania nivea]|nr:hypothetical protein EV426DRAFT_577208 [Tirmania nivea]